MRRILLLFGLFCVVMMPIQAQTQIPRAQAIFIYNFSRLVEWPVAYKSGPFIIGVFGNSTVANELETYASGKKVGIQDILIKQYRSAEEISTCHILFIPFAKTKQLPDILKAVQDKNTLLITEKNGALDEGSAINFVLLADRIKFEVQADNITKYGLKYSSKLQEMAKGGS
jgi:hypothetical protein